MTLPTLILASCSVLTAPEVIEDFQFTELMQGHAVEETADARAFSGEVVFLGQIKTPHVCYDLRGELEKSGSTLTLRVTAEPRNTQCSQLLGAYRYTGAVRGIKTGRWDFVIVQRVAGQPERTFEFPLVVQ